jgi:valyl-tRNA synthetase
MAAQQTLYYTMEKTLQLLAPVMPHITEEIYSYMYAKGSADSIHIRQWPSCDFSIDEETERIGDLFIEVIAELRKDKNKRGISLNKPVKSLNIYGDEKMQSSLRLTEADLKETLKIERIEYSEGVGETNVEGREGLSFTLQP